MRCYKSGGGLSGQVTIKIFEDRGMNFIVGEGDMKTEKQKMGFWDKFPLPPDGLQPAPYEPVWAGEKTYLEFKPKVTSGLRTKFPSEIALLLFLIPLAQIPQGTSCLI